MMKKKGWEKKYAKKRVEKESMQKKTGEVANQLLSWPAVIIP